MVQLSELLIVTRDVIIRFKAVASGGLVWNCVLRMQVHYEQAVMLIASNYTQQ